MSGGKKLLIPSPPYTHVHRPKQDQLWPVLDQWNEIAAVFSELWQGGKKKSIISKATLFFHGLENDLVESEW